MHDRPTPRPPSTLLPRGCALSRDDGAVSLARHMTAPSSSLASSTLINKYVRLHMEVEVQNGIFYSSGSQICCVRARSIRDELQSWLWPAGTTKTAASGSRSSSARRSAPPRNSPSSPRRWWRRPRPGTTRSSSRWSIWTITAQKMRIEEYQEKLKK